MKVLFVVLLILSTVLLFASAVHKRSKIVNKEAGMNEVDPLDPSTRVRIDTTISHWPQLLGKTGAEAEAAIKADRPDLTIHTLSKNAMTTMDFKTDRIRIFVDENNVVVRPPMIVSFIPRGCGLSKYHFRKRLAIQAAQQFSVDPNIISPFGDAKGSVIEYTTTNPSPLSLNSENVESVLNEMRPYLIEDGGNVRFDGIDGTIVRLELEGACVGCPSSAQTLKMGLERKLKQRIPSITEVIRVSQDFPEITRDNIEIVLNKIRPIIAVSGCNVELLALSASDGNAPQIKFKMTGGTVGMQAVKFEIVQRLRKYFNVGVIVSWE